MEKYGLARETITEDATFYCRSQEESDSPKGSGGYTVKEIIKRLDQEEVNVSRTALFKLFCKYREHKRVADRPKAGLPRS